MVPQLFDFLHVESDFESGETRIELPVKTFRVVTKVLSSSQVADISAQQAFHFHLQELIQRAELGTRFLSHLPV